MAPMVRHSPACDDLADIHPADIRQRDQQWGTMATGTISRFDEEMGYGFAMMENGVEIFVHRTETATPDVTVLKVGDRVCFDAVRSEKGVVATDVPVGVDCRGRG